LVKFLAAHTGETSMNKTGTDWERLRRMGEAEIRAAVSADPEIIPTDTDFWESATVVLPQRKPTITIRLDANVLAWLKTQEKGYQTRINAILRAYMNAQDSGASR
jgi:uncharacterized protein (DUF4415 family)